MNAAPVLRRIHVALKRAGLEAILIGNAAAAIQGAPVTTLDFDFMIRDTPDSARKLRKVADQLGAAIYRPYYPVSAMLRLQTDAGLQVDFLMRIHGIRSFEQLRAHAEDLDAGGFTVRVASLSDIIRSKRAAGRPKDLAVLPTLERTQREREDEEES
jgi:predicted nucleotidyltransferase